jgi:hypothetical protein
MVCVAIDSAHEARRGTPLQSATNACDFTSAFMNLRFVHVSLVIATTLASPLPVWAAECAAPPVLTAEQAACLGRQFIERSPPPPWELKYEVRDAGSRWVVYYGPSQRGVRGGGGELSVNKKSGVVIFVQGSR